MNSLNLDCRESKMADGLFPVPDEIEQNASKKTKSYAHEKTFILLDKRTKCNYSKQH